MHFIPNRCLDAYEVKVNTGIFKYQEKVKIISQLQVFFFIFQWLIGIMKNFKKYFEVFASIRNVYPMQREFWDLHNLPHDQGIIITNEYQKRSKNLVFA